MIRTLKFVDIVTGQASSKNEIIRQRIDCQPYIPTDGNIKA